MDSNKEHQLFLSVIVPTYNSSNIIQQTINQLHKEINTYQYSFEIIIVNDGSEDNTTQCIQNFCKEDFLQNVRIIENEKNYGQSIATINGIRAAKGEYIIILDDDLQYEPNQIKLLLNKILEENNIKMICGYKINENKTKDGISMIAIKFSMFLLKVYFKKFYALNYFTPFKIFHQSLFQNKSKLNIYYFWTFNTKQITSIPIKHAKSTRKKSNYNIFRLLSEYNFLIQKIIQKTTFFLIIFFSISLILCNIVSANHCRILTTQAFVINSIIYLVTSLLLFIKNKYMTNRKYIEIS